MRLSATPHRFAYGQTPDRRHRDEPTTIPIYGKFSGFAASSDCAGSVAFFPSTARQIPIYGKFSGFAASSVCAESADFFPSTARQIAV